MTARILAAALAVALTLAPHGAPGDAHRARCHGDPRPRLGLGARGGPWTCDPRTGWYWPVGPIVTPTVSGVRIPASPAASVR